MILRTTCFKQFGNARQTAGDVIGLGAFQRNTGKNVTGRNLVARFNRQDRIHGEEVTGFATTVHFRILPSLHLDDNGRFQVSAARIGAPVENDTLGDTGGFVSGSL